MALSIKITKLNPIKPITIKLLKYYLLIDLLNLYLFNLTQVTKHLN